MRICLVVKQSRRKALVRVEEIVTEGKPLEGVLVDEEVDADVREVAPRYLRTLVVL
jgi:hypothetical protein